MKQAKNYSELVNYLAGSTEAQSTSDHLIQVITPLFKGYGKKEFSMLDVGCSDGTFSLLLLDKLTKLVPNIKVSAIEPEVPAYEVFSKRASNRNYIQHENTGVQDFLRKNKDRKELFDFIMFSQCFYHFPKEEWSPIIKQSNQLLKKGGYIAIMMDSHNCKAYTLKYVITDGKAATLEFGDLYSAEDIEDFLKKKEIKYRVSSSPTYLSVKDDANKTDNFVRHLCFLYRTSPDLIYPRYEKEIKEMLETNKRQKDYHIENLVKTILFRKTCSKL